MYNDDNQFLFLAMRVLVAVLVVVLATATLISCVEDECKTASYEASVCKNAHSVIDCEDCLKETVKSSDCKEKHADDCQETIFCLEKEVISKNCSNF